MSENTPPHKLSRGKMHLILEVYNFWGIALRVGGRNSTQSARNFPDIEIIGFLNKA